MNPIPRIAAVALALAAPASFAQKPTLYMSAYGGSTETFFKERIIPPFEAKHGVKVVYISGNSTDTLAKLQAQKSKQEIDVVLMDDGPMQQAVQGGFCETMKPEVYQPLYPIAKVNDKSVAIGVVATGLAYNVEAFKKLGLPKPDSWEALTDKRLKQKTVVMSITNSYGLQTLVMFARLRGGGEKAIDAGFDTMSTQVAPNVLAWEPSNAKLTELFQTGDIALAVWGSGRTLTLKETGFPVDFVYPKEGAMALGVHTCQVVQSDVPQHAQALIQYLLTPEIQALLADKQGWGPVNKATKLSPAVAAKVPYGEAQIGKLIPVDWSVVNAKRPEWTNRWNREIER